MIEKKLHTIHVTLLFILFVLCILVGVMIAK